MAGDPDTELLAALENLGDLRLLGYGTFTEAAVAWRARNDETAAALARRAHEVFVRTSNHVGSLLSGALLVSLGSEPPESMQERLRACPLPMARDQAARLASGVDARGQPLRGVPRGIGKRREILSLEEIHG
jgi:hypothetical protein